jgi:hypothetical protein
METPKANKSALDIILEWSLSRSAWQRDALRRIVANGSLTDTDISELVALCKKEHGETSIKQSAKPLEKRDLPASPRAGQAISLLSLSGVEGVNQLAPNQELPFETKGLTIVYGDNGAGKSGYARVLKRTCRARFPGEIMPDAYKKQMARRHPLQLLTNRAVRSSQPYSGMTMENLIRSCRPSTCSTANVERFMFGTKTKLRFGLSVWIYPMSWLTPVSESKPR